MTTADVIQEALALGWRYECLSTPGGRLNGTAKRYMVLTNIPKRKRYCWICGKIKHQKYYLRRQGCCNLCQAARTS